MACKFAIGNIETDDDFEVVCDNFDEMIELCKKIAPALIQKGWTYTPVTSDGTSIIVHPRVEPSDIFSLLKRYGIEEEE